MFPANRFDDDFRRFFSQFLCHSWYAIRERSRRSRTGVAPCAHFGNCRLQIGDAIVSEAFLQSFLLCARQPRPRDLFVLLQPARQQLAAPLEYRIGGSR
jgi:hypothetical protein